MKTNRIFLGDAYSGLLNIDDCSIDIAITSPPYWNQRDYEFDGQIGTENSPEEYVYNLSEIFLQLKTKLKNYGVFFLNIGDKYLSKYGKTPLGFIPFLLADKMVKNGWYLSDTIIWYKPNHMPSSIKNRFTNSYEPIFVFSKSSKNYYTLNINISNIVKIKLQPTPYKHVAVYPEKLIENLLNMVKLPKCPKILDPFAGSGTTLKAVQNLGITSETLLIEKNPEYVDIIIERCNLSKNDVIKLKNKVRPIFYNSSSQSQLQLFYEDSNPYYKFNTDKKGFVKLCKTKSEYYNLLDYFLSKRIKFKYPLESIFFIGSMDFDLELILKTSNLNKHGYVIRNMIVVEKDNRWFPIFFMVDDNKKTNYIFNYEKLNIESKSKQNKNWFEYDLKNVKVINNLNKRKKIGFILQTFETNSENLPQYSLVKWEDGNITTEIIIHNNHNYNSNLNILITENNIEIKEKKNLISQKYFSQNILKTPNERKKITPKSYNGKFNFLSRKNWGASPGARASVEEIYFSSKRLYNVDQKLVAKYLNLKRIEKGLSKTEFINLFPADYKHTIGHWLRDDFGGSIPNLDDWKLIQEKINIDEGFIKYVCTTGIKLQTIIHSNIKPPEDFISYDFIEKLKLLFEE